MSPRRESLSDYYGRMAIMWDELYTYKPIPECTCGALEKLTKEREEEKVDQFVMGLNESRFANVINASVDSDPPPDLEQVYLCVIREQQRLQTAKIHEQPSKAVGFTTRRDSQPDLSVRRESRPDQRGDSTGSRNRDRLLCSHWVTERNTRNTGRGSSHGGRSGSPAGKGHATANVDNATSPHSSVFPELTAEQWRAISLMAQQKT